MDIFSPEYSRLRKLNKSPKHILAKHFIVTTRHLALHIQADNLLMTRSFVNIIVNNNIFIVSLYVNRKLICISRCKQAFSSSWFSRFTQKASISNSWIASLVNRAFHWKAEGRRFEFHRGHIFSSQNFSNFRKLQQILQLWWLFTRLPFQTNMHFQNIILLKIFQFLYWHTFRKIFITSLTWT